MNIDSHSRFLPFVVLRWVQAWFYRLFFKPTAKSEDSQRQEFILNTLLLSSLFIAFIAITRIAIRIGLSEDNAARLDRLYLLIVIFAVFLALYLLSRLRFYKISAVILTLLYLILGTFTLLVWGIALPTGLMVYVLVIVMAGILLGTRFALLITFLTCFNLLFLIELNLRGTIQPDLAWSLIPPGLSDAIGFATFLIIIFIVSWLSNREIEKSLMRARKSEKALKEERDLLEVKVLERTRELQRSQREKVAQLYRFAEWGKVASGIFHDLANPLTTISLNLEKMGADIQSVMLERALEATRSMERFIQLAQKQIRDEREFIWFAPAEELGLVLHGLDAKVSAKDIVIEVDIDPAIRLYGSPIKFYQLLNNLVNNAIDSYDTVSAQHKSRIVKITMEELSQEIILRVHDQGSGIAPKDLKRIFQPFFTTKGEYGTGIGLSICRDIMEKDFAGGIVVESTSEKGTTFLATFVQQATEQIN